MAFHILSEALLAGCKLIFSNHFWAFSSTSLLFDSKIFSKISEKEISYQQVEDKVQNQDLNTIDNAVNSIIKKIVNEDKFIKPIETFNVSYDKEQDTSVYSSCCSILWKIIII